MHLNLQLSLVSIIKLCNSKCSSVPCTIPDFLSLNYRNPEGMLALITHVNVRAHLQCVSGIKICGLFLFFAFDVVCNNRIKSYKMYIHVHIHIYDPMQS